MARTLLNLIHGAYVASLHRNALAFRRSLKAPAKTQQARFAEILATNRNSAFGQAHQFDAIRNVRQFQSRVPVRDYAQMQPWIDRVLAGEQDVLTSERVLMVERSGGSTSANKYIPFTASLLTEIANATQPWLWDLYSHVPGLRGTSAYWSISPLSHQEKMTQGGVPIGFEDESAYFGPVVRWAINRMMAVPSTVRTLRDDQQWQQETLARLVADQNLGLISVWSPTFLTVLLQALVNDPDPVMARMPRTAQRRLGRALATGSLDTRTLWPSLKLISCWKDGVSRDFAATLSSWFPDVPIQGKGLLATEGVITVPFGRLAHTLHDKQAASHGCVIAINSHFYEFIDLNGDPARLLMVDELKVGGVYSPVITTAGGLYRYHLKDVVTCSGFQCNTPELVFSGKLDRVSDLCGEKLNATFVEPIIDQVLQSQGIHAHFAMLSPSPADHRRYTLFIDADYDPAKNAELSSNIEGCLQQSHHYHYCRQRGQLLPLRIVKVNDGWSRYQQHLVNHGQRLGDIKPTRLETRHDWHSVFSTSGDRP